MGGMKDMSDDDWKNRLTQEQYHVLREKGTEAPFTGDLLENKETGEYKCAACGNVIFKSDDKYESHMPGLAGWPSFSKVADSGTVELVPDDSHGMHRVEVVCTNCGSHLGHVFDDPESPSGNHYCINSCALDFKKQ